MATISRLMTEEEFLALPDDDGVERELIRGELVERPMTTRNYAHCTVSTRIGFHLTTWLVNQPPPRGSIVSGEARIRLRRDPLTFVGVDVAYIAAETRPSDPREARYVDGPPVLVVEILSPHDKQKDIEDKVADYLDAGVPLVWIVAPRFSTVTVYRPDAKPQLFNADQELTAEPFLPGFRVAVADLFEDLD
jgi:Uma2 family endonuclease